MQHLTKKEGHCNRCQASAGDWCFRVDIGFGIVPVSEAADTCFISF